MDLQSLRETKVKHVFRIKWIDILSFLVLASTIFVYGISLVFSSIDQVVIMMGFLFVCLYYLISKKQFDNCVVMLGIYSMWLCVSNLFNSRSLIFSIYHPVKMVTFVLLNKIYLDKRDKTLLKITRHYLTLIILVNFMIQMIDQDMFGYTNSHNYINFFESDNYLGWYYVPYIVLCMILDFIEQDKIRPVTYLEIGLCMASIVRAWVGKTIVALVVIILYILFVYRKKIANCFLPKFLWIGYIVIDVGIVFFGMQGVISPIFYELLGKDATLTGRTIIWLTTIRNIQKSPILGYGITRGGELYINRLPSGVLVPAHNIFLEVAVQAGIVGLTIYILMLLIMFATGHRKYMKSLRHQSYRYEYLFLVFMIFMMFVMAILSNPVYIPFFYLPLILLTSFDAIVDMHEMNGYGAKQRYS